MRLHDAKDALRFGEPLGRAQAAVILVHGRGSSPEDVAGLSELFPGAGAAFLAPAAQGGTWYPLRFLAPPDDNEPWLSSALGVIGELAAEAREAGIPGERLGLVGFSQGACLALEYAARHPRRYAFVAGLSGALIGPADLGRPPGDLAATPVLLGCAERDPHIPREYVESSAASLLRLKADVTTRIFPGSGHQVFPEEIAWLRARAPALTGAGRSP